MPNALSPLPRRFPFRLAMALAAVVASPAAAFAQVTPAPADEAPAAGDTIRLTDEQRMAILDSNTPESGAAARGELTGAQRAARGIHGEMGVMVGSSGSRGVYGTADIPLGDNAGATVSFESSRFGYRR
jgi:hypothetical protein